jgi:hypothetical protein
VARLDPQLRRAYQRLKSRRNNGVAKVAVACCLTVRWCWMLRTRRNYLLLVKMSDSTSSAVVPSRGIEGLIGRRTSLHEAGRSNGEP